MRVEKADISMRLLVRAGGIFAALVPVVLLVMWWVLPPRYTNQENQLLRNRTTVARDFPRPLLEQAPRLERLEYDRAQEHQLTSYGWVNRDRGLVRIPVEEAMKKMAERGFAQKGMP